MENKEETFELTAVYEDKEIDLTKLNIHMKFGDKEADVDADTAIRRSIQLAQENMLLHTAIREIKNHMDAEAAKSKIVVAQPNDIPEAPRGS